MKHVNLVRLFRFVLWSLVLSPIFAPRLLFATLRSALWSREDVIQPSIEWMHGIFPGHSWTATVDWKITYEEWCPNCCAHRWPPGVPKGGPGCAAQ